MSVVKLGWGSTQFSFALVIGTHSRTVPSSLIEALIAMSIFVAAVHAILPIFAWKQICVVNFSDRSMGWSSPKRSANLTRELADQELRTSLARRGMPPLMRRSLGWIVHRSHTMIGHAIHVLLQCGAVEWDKGCDRQRAAGPSDGLGVSRWTPRARPNLTSREWHPSGTPSRLPRSQP